MAKSYKVTVIAGTKVVADMAKNVLDATIEASLQVKTIAGGASSATPTILAPGPAGQNRKMEDVVGWFVNGTGNPLVAVGEPWEAPAGFKNTNWWDGVAGTWSLGSSVSLPKGADGVNGKTIELFSATKENGYAVGDQVFFNSDIWEVTTAAAQGETPLTKPDKFKKVFYGVQYTELYRNLITTGIGEARTNYTANSDGSIKIYRGSAETTTGWRFITFNLKTNTFWTKSHQYYVLLDITVNSLQGFDAGAEVDFGILPKSGSSIIVGTKTNIVRAKVGSRTMMKLKLDITMPTGDYADANKLYVQFINATGSNQVYDVTIHKMLVVDLTASNISTDIIDSYVDENGIEDVKIVPEFVLREDGKTLSSNDYTDTDKEKLTATNIYTSADKAKLDSIGQKIIYDNISKSLRFQSVIGGLVKTDNPDGSIKLVKTSAISSGWKGVNLLLDSDKAFIKNHVYYVAVDILVNQNSLTEGSTSSAGNNSFTIVAKDNADSRTLVSVLPSSSTTTTGTRSVISVTLNINDPNNYISPNSRWVYIQFGNYQIDQTLDVDIHKLFIIDLTANNLTKDQMDAYIATYGLMDTLSIFDFEVTKAQTADYALVAKSVENLVIGGTLHLWGDSLVGQKWGDFLAQILGRPVISHGYGGKKSSYIRDQFIANPVVTQFPQIICVGRNNYPNTEVIIDDIRRMVKAMGHLNFLILTPPNGNYGTLNGTELTLGELKGGPAYKQFIELETRLAAEYGSNYLNSRIGTIQSYDNGGVTLLNSFTQPAVGGQVQVNVSDADFLTNYNPSTVSKWGATIVERVVIGINGIFDTYKIVNKIDSTTLLLELVESKRIAPGATVSNLVDDGGTNSVIYLRVMQNADWISYQNDITQSSFRIDDIHMSYGGMICLAKVVANKINLMKI